MSAKEHPVESSQTDEIKHDDPLKKLLAKLNQIHQKAMVFGPSIQCPKCQIENNPNNIYCWHCATLL